MNFKNEKGSITIFVIIGMLFMSAFLIISYSSNVNRSKVVKEQFDIISDIYSYKDGNESSYERTYTALRKKNKQIMTATSEGTENLASIVLTKTFEEEMKNYKIYGNTNGVGNQITDETDTNYGKYEIPIKVYRTDSQDNLPSYLLEQYQELEYIESNGTQYVYKIFETSHEVGSTFTWETEIMWTNTSTRQIMGNNDPLYWGINASGKYECGTVSNVYASTDKYDKVKYVITQLAETEEEQKQKKELYINGQYATGRETTQAYFAKKQIYMLSYKGNKSLNTYGRVKYFKFYDNDELIGNLIPCYRKSDKKTGMYDLVDNIFYEAQGGNEFIKGPNTSAGYRVCLERPLMQVGTVEDYIDFEEQKIIRHIDENGEILETPIEEQIQLPELLTYEDYTKIEILTDVKPSKVELEYTGYKFD